MVLQQEKDSTLAKPRWTRLRETCIGGGSRYLVNQCDVHISWHRHHAYQQEKERLCYVV